MRFGASKRAFWDSMEKSSHKNRLAEREKTPTIGLDISSGGKPDGRPIGLFSEAGTWSAAEIAAWFGEAGLKATRPRSPWMMTGLALHVGRKPE